MPDTTGHDVHVDLPLSQMAIGYRPEGFIADAIFPIVNVGKQSDAYTIFSRADRLRVDKTIRAPGTEARRITEGVSSGTYNAVNYALKRCVTIEDRNNADPVFVSELYNQAAQLVLDKLLLDWEVRVSNMVNSGSNVGSYAAVSSAWTGSGADPIADVNAALDNVHYSNGVRPTDLVMGVEAWQKFRRHSSVTNKIFGNNNGGGFASREAVRNLFEIERLHIGGAFQNTGEEYPDASGESLSDIWGDNLLAFYRPATPVRDRPSFAYSLRWAAPGLPNMQVERHPYDSKIKAEEVEVGYYQDEKITGASYGFLLTNVTSST